MRALILVLALVATPLALGMSQMPGSSSCDNGNGDQNRSDSGQAHAHQGLCAPQPPPPPPPPAGCVNSTGSGGTGSITGTVMLDVTFTGQAGWCIDVSGPVTAQAVTDASGNYVVPGLPAGSYLVCEEVQTGFQETSPTSGPTCPSGIGWTISVFDNSESGFVSFTNLPL